jgi:hypothetical protein
MFLLKISGITTFKSRSFSDWQKSGGKNLFPGKFDHVGNILSSVAALNLDLTEQSHFGEQILR